MAVKFDQYKILFDSVKISRGNHYSLSGPSLNLILSIKNDSGFDVKLDRLFYRINLNISDWRGIGLGFGAYLQPRKIEKGKNEVAFHYELDFETIRKIDQRMKSFSDNIIWEIRVDAYFEGPEGAFSRDETIMGGEQKDPWTAYSVWKVWLDYWSKKMPRTYEYVDRFDDLNKRLEERLSQLEETLIRARSLVERLEALRAALER